MFLGSTMPPMYLRILKLAVCAAAALLVSALNAQTPVPATALPVAAPPAGNVNRAGASATNQLIERIQVEGSDIRIDEIRVGGETRSITVTPTGFPAYTVQPKTGERTWKLFDF